MLENSILPLSKNTFYQKVQIKFNNILDGFDNYKHFTIYGDDLKQDEDKMINFIISAFEYNNSSCYIDLYLSKLNDESKKYLYDSLIPEDKDILNHILSLNNPGIYYEVKSKDIIPFLVRLNTRELFFVTFYFTVHEVTIWGNYNLKFPCFSSDEEILNNYKSLSENLNLKYY